MTSQPPRRFDPARIAFQITLAGAISAALFLAGLYSGTTRNAAFRAVDFVKQSVRSVLSERDNLAGTVPTGFLQPARTPGEGVTVNTRPDDGRLILLTSFFDGGTELRLIRRDGSVVAKWPVQHSRLFPDPDFLFEPPQTDWNIDLHGTAINPDGSVVFNFEYGGTAKLDRCGKTIWTLREPTHHSVVRSERGGYWIPGQRHYLTDSENRFDPFTRVSTDEAFTEDEVLHVSEDGAVTQRLSMVEVLYGGGLMPVLTAGGFSFLADGNWSRELAHLNKLAELSAADAAAFPQFAAGDLLASLRTHNLLVVFDPDTGQVKWHQTGPWLRQHDAEFMPDGTITVFNNNAFRLDLLPGDRTDLTRPQVSNIMKVDPRTGAATVVAGQRLGQEFYSVIRGKQQPLPDGGFLITDTGNGRAFELDGTGALVWEYVNRYDDRRVLEITEAQNHPAEYFTVTDWSCPAPSGN